jgi:hypothetical protein
MNQLRGNVVWSLIFIHKYAGIVEVTVAVKLNNVAFLRYGMRLISHITNIFVNIYFYHRMK